MAAIYWLIAFVVLVGIEIIMRKMGSFLLRM